MIILISQYTQDDYLLVILSIMNYCNYIVIMEEEKQEAADLPL